MTRQGYRGEETFSEAYSLKKKSEKMLCSKKSRTETLPAREFK